MCAERQSERFKLSEADRWLQRNKSKMEKMTYPTDDDISLLVQRTPLQPGSNILEIGCGYPSRLQWLSQNGFNCKGVDPSSDSVLAGKNLGIEISKGTAENLPFVDHSFDLVIFGFCLYLCDREDLFQIAAEANRVLNKSGWLIIKDFFSRAPNENAYAHYQGIKSYKMNNTDIFTWHPAYTLMSHEIHHHQRNTYTDEQNEWVSVSLLRKIDYR